MLAHTLKGEGEGGEEGVGEGRAEGRRVLVEVESNGGATSPAPIEPPVRHLLRQCLTAGRGCSARRKKTSYFKFFS
jgi:hypothetical protein